MPFSGGPASLFPRSPSLWQLEQAPVKSARPFAASPGFSTSGSSAAMMSSFAFAAGDSASRSAAACSRHLPVRMRAQPRHVGGAEVRRRDCAVLHRGQQRERGVRTLQELIEQAASSWSRASAAIMHGIDIRCPRSRPARRSGRPFSGAGTAGSDSIGAIVESACARRAGTASRPPALSMRRSSLAVASPSSRSMRCA